MNKIFILLSFFILFPLSANAGDFGIEFDWSNLKKCTSGTPNRVENPTFTLKNVPVGTKWIYFKLVDYNSTFDHGGGWVEYTGQSTVEPGAFKYASPCPPNGRHKYEWTASAKAKKSSFSGTIQAAKSSKMYP
jgi:phosphatidylethanolamine-binding protein (PEBP) family uncharacterized protein